MDKTKWNKLYRKYRIKISVEKLKEEQGQDYHYPDYPVELKGGKYAWWPKQPNLIMHIPTNNYFSISNDNLDKLFGVQEDPTDWFSDQSTKRIIGDYILIATMLEEGGQGV